MQTRGRSIEHCAVSKFTFVRECRQTADGQLSWLSLLGLARGRRLAVQEALKLEEAQVGRTSAGDPGNPAENPGKPAGDPGKPAGTGFAKKLETRIAAKSIVWLWSLDSRSKAQSISLMHIVLARFSFQFSLHCCDGGADGLELAGVCSVLFGGCLFLSIFRILFVVC